MATNPRRFHVTELDFDNVKSNLKTFLKGQTEFTDYDFEGSGMNILLDTLAYNTHYLAYNVNMAMNEAFLDSALLRSSVVSHAKSLGYTPRSARAPIAYINVQLNDNILSSATLLKGTSFTTSVDEVNYTFVTNSDYTINRQNGILKFLNVPIYEGTLVTTKYTVDKSNVDQRFILASKNADTTTLKVSVQSSSSDSTTTVYSLAEDISEITSNQLVYFLQEIENEKFEVYFGDGIIGQDVSDGNIVILEYVVTNKTAANSANVFSPPGDISSVNNITVSTVISAYGGSDSESIESIRYNAPLDYSSQGRAVTIEDYKLLIPKLYSNAAAVQVWGGEDNDPPQYGQVFISIKTVNDSSLTQLQKDDILSKLSRYNVSSTRASIVNPEIIYLVISTTFKYNSLATTKSNTDLEAIVKNVIINYNSTSLQKFDEVFRYSKFVNLIDDSDTSIMSNITNFKVYKKIYPLNTDITEKFTINFSNKIYNPHAGHIYAISSSGFYITGYTDVFYFDDDGYGNIRLYYLVSGSIRTYLNETIGTIDYATGKIELSSLSVSSTVNSDNSINIICATDSLDIVPVRNQIIAIDTDNITVIGEVDTIKSGGSNAGTTYNTTSFYT